MIGRITAKLAQSFATILLASFATFFLARSLPGRPFEGESALRPEIKAALANRYGLDRPLFAQYRHFLWSAAHGDFGPSFGHDGKPVSAVLGEAAPVSFELGSLAFLFAVAIGIPWGALSAINKYGLFGKACEGLAILAAAVPIFILGPLLTQVFSLGYPFGALRDFLPAGLWEGPTFWVLPAIALGLRPAATFARLISASLSEALQSDYARVARAKGAPPSAIVFRHALKNSLLPMVAEAGPMAASILSGSFVVEMIFAVPGMGRHFIEGVSDRDYPLILGVTVIYALLLTSINLIDDLIFEALDPRLRRA